MCSEYGYEVEFTGVGEALHGHHDSVGFCSQIGVFYRLTASYPPNTLGDDEDVFSYTLVSVPIDLCFLSEKVTSPL